MAGADYWGMMVLDVLLGINYLHVRKRRKSAFNFVDLKLSVLRTVELNRQFIERVGDGKSHFWLLVQNCNGRHSAICFPPKPWL